MKSWNVVSLHFYSTPATLAGTDYSRVDASRTFLYLDKFKTCSGVYIAYKIWRWYSSVYYAHRYLFYFFYFYGYATWWGCIRCGLKLLVAAALTDPCLAAELYLLRVTVMKRVSVAKFITKNIWYDL